MLHKIFDQIYDFLDNETHNYTIENDGGYDNWWEYSTADISFLGFFFDYEDTIRFVKMFKKYLHKQALITDPLIIDLYYDQMIKSVKIAAKQMERPEVNFLIDQTNTNFQKGYLF